MEIKVIEGAFSVCRLKDLGQARMEDDLYFLGRTDAVSYTHLKGRGVRIGNPGYLEDDHGTSGGSGYRMYCIRHIVYCKGVL